MYNIIIKDNDPDVNDNAEVKETENEKTVREELEKEERAKSATITVRTLNSAIGLTIALLNIFISSFTDNY